MRYTALRLVNDMISLSIDPFLWIKLIRLYSQICKRAISLNCLLSSFGCSFKLDC
jgi:hypothetical protein